ncbi:hypothetical protein QL285_052754 [Trifolium repens]|nr:hypothetical protein QL285_052754 [Trifolium repens]
MLVSSKVFAFLHWIQKEQQELDFLPETVMVEIDRTRVGLHIKRSIFHKWSNQKSSAKESIFVHILTTYRHNMFPLGQLME